MTTFTDTKIISLNTESAGLKNGSYLSSVSFNLQGLLKDEPDIIHRQITLQNAQLPVSFYIVNYTNKTFVIKFGATDYTITIPVGNYNANTLITAIQSAILTATTNVVSVAISKISGIFTFTSSLAFTLRSSLSTFTMRTILGLDRTDLVATFTTSYNATLPYPCNLLGTKLIQVNSPVISGNNYSSNLNGQTTLLATIPVQAPSFGLILYFDTGDTRVSFNNNNLDGIDIDIIDAETGQYINFNNCNWTMTLLLHITRKYNDTEKTTMQDFIKNAIPLPPPPINLGNSSVVQEKPLTEDEKQLKLLTS